MEIPYPSKWDEEKMSGRDWYYGFMRRHQELSLRTPEQTTLHRVKSFSKENVQMFFNNLDAVLSAHPYQAAEIWTMDETGFSTVPTKIGKVISMRGARRVGLHRLRKRSALEVRENDKKLFFVSKLRLRLNKFSEFFIVNMSKCFKNQ